MEWKRVGKTMVYFIVLLIIILIIGVGVKLQIDTEDYIQTQKGEYGFVKDRNRIKHTPVLIYLIELNMFKNKEIDTEAFFLPWEGIECARDIHYMGNSYMQKYLIHCFYTDEEKVEYIKRRNDNPWDQNKHTPF